ncbi:MAG: hydantoinase/oxoprolinase family protein, partial [Nitrosopumilaceae archaeon]
ISSIGVACSMIQEELEHTITNPTPEQILNIHKKIHAIVVEKGAVPESVVINSEYIPEKSILRVTAIGNVEYEKEFAKNVFTLDDALIRASEIIQIPKDLIELSFETDTYFVFTGHVEQKRLFGKKKQHHIVILDRHGRIKLSVKNGRLFQGGTLSVIEEFEEFLESKQHEVAPQVHLLNDLKLIDFSGLTSSSNITTAIKQELEGSTKAAVVVELK